MMSSCGWSGQEGFISILHTYYAHEHVSRDRSMNILLTPRHKNSPHSIYAVKNARA